jgi:hypothetical protein
MKILIMLVSLLTLNACSETPRNQIVFTGEETCKIIINDLQYGQANEMERYCIRETISDTEIISINFLSKTCNAYRYSFKQARENSDGIYVFEHKFNEPNPLCQFIPEYSNPNSQWVLASQVPYR